MAQKTQLHERLKYLRKSANLTLEDVAQAFDPPISKNAVALWECGDSERRTKPSTQRLQTFSKLTGAPIDWILSDESTISSNWIIEETPENQVYELLDIFRKLPADARQKILTAAKKEKLKSK